MKKDGDNTKVYIFDETALPGVYDLSICDRDNIGPSFRIADLFILRFGKLPCAMWRSMRLEDGMVVKGATHETRGSKILVANGYWIREACYTWKVNSRTAVTVHSSTSYFCHCEDLDLSVVHARFDGGILLYHTTERGWFGGKIDWAEVKGGKV